jgi:hypothetical protein
VANQVFQLVVRTGPRPGQIYPLELDVLNIGRDPLSDIVLDDLEVSRHHARLTKTTSGYELQDLGSTNGSFVDGQRLSGGATALNPGQVLMLGSNVTLVYQALEEPDPMATVVAPAADIFASAEESVEPVAEVEPEIEAAAVEEEVMAEDEANADDEAPTDMDVVDEAPAEEAPLEEAPAEEARIEEPEPVEVEEEVAFTPVPATDDLSQLADDPLVVAEEVATEDEDFTATMIDELPQFEELEISTEPEVESMADEPEELPAIDAPSMTDETAVAPEEPEELPAFITDSLTEEPPEAPQEPEEWAAFETPSVPEEPAVTPPEPDSLSTFEAPPPEPPKSEPERFPEFSEKEDATIIDSGEPLQAFDMQAPPPPIEPEIVADGGTKDNRNRNIIIAVVAAILLCCCCLIVLAAIVITNGNVSTTF